MARTAYLLFTPTFVIHRSDANMPLIASIGQAQDLDGHEAGMRAAQQALSQLGRIAPVLGFVVSSHDYPIPIVLSGISAQLGDTPLLGFSSTAELTARGRLQHTVAVALLGGNELQASAKWWPIFGREAGGSQGFTAAQRMLQALDLDDGSLVLFAADGMSEEAASLVTELHTALAYTRSKPEAIGPPSIQVVGCLTEADPRQQRTIQIGGLQGGEAGLAAARIGGKIALGIGVGHGWQPVGIYFQATHSHGHRLERLGDLPAVEVYARLFGYEAQAWRQFPLNELICLYPLGVEQSGIKQVEVKDFPYLVRTPRLVEQDGSLRMIPPIPESSIVHLMVGSVEACLEAARRAALQALSALTRPEGVARPVLALVWVDTAWQKLLAAQAGSELQAVRSVLGTQVPVLGGYTYGQAASLPPSGSLELLSQHIQVLVFGEPSS